MIKKQRAVAATAAANFTAAATATAAEAAAAPAAEASASARSVPLKLALLLVTIALSITTVESQRYCAFNGTSIGTLLGNTTSAASIKKIGFLYNSPVGDLGYTYSHNMGRNRLESIFRSQIITEYVIAPETNTANVKAEIANFIKRGFGKATVPFTLLLMYNIWIHDGYLSVHAARADMIVSTSYGHGDAMYAASLEYPATKFLSVSTEKTRPNLATGFGRIEEARYVRARPLFIGASG